MVVKTVKTTEKAFEAYLIPFEPDRNYRLNRGTQFDSAVEYALKNHFTKLNGEIYQMNLFMDGQMTTICLVDIGNVKNNKTRTIRQKMMEAFSRITKQPIQNLLVMLENIPDLFQNKNLIKQIFATPIYQSYAFEEYITKNLKPKLQEICFSVSDFDVSKEMEEAVLYGEASRITRDLVNHPSAYMTPRRLAEQAKAYGDYYGIEVEIFGKEKIKALEMNAFLAVGNGSSQEPQLIVMRYKGTESKQDIIGLVGKGVTFDSGGYSLKRKMDTMHGDMGGAGAVIGALLMTAVLKLKVNVTVVIAACENKIGPEAYVPGDILYSMSGKTIEMVNADAEGRLTIADAMTYLIRHEQAKTLIDIATLTGAARTAVGNQTAPVITNQEDLWQIAEKASLLSCEKIWRLDADDELLPVLHSSVADLKNSNPDSIAGGESIVAALFIREFVEQHPWLHIDMAPVNFNKTSSLFNKGATGYGVGLLYEMLKGFEKPTNLDKQS
ncbi:MAG: leucyl aminopeptidase family protein [Tissierellales bacterium]|nr:leucyl aminopeptidase family protein [Tissierellales bacterium]MBN2826917.1 leucyl aminopeptidase family protein [Tissierellales bacterium]